MAKVLVFLFFFFLFCLGLGLQQSMLRNNKRHLGVWAFLGNGHENGKACIACISDKPPGSARQ